MALPCAGNIIPIARLDQGLESPDHRVVHGVVTLLWPFDSGTESLSLLLVEPDFRLRRQKGQVKVCFFGRSAQAVADAGIRSADTLLLHLNGATCASVSTAALAPEGGLHLELQYRERLNLQLFRHTQAPINIDIKKEGLSSKFRSVPTFACTPTAPDGDAIGIPHDNEHVPPTDQPAWSSPAFLKRSQGPPSNHLAEIELIDGLDVPENFKRRKLGWNNRQWTLLGTTDLREEDDDAAIATTGGLQHQRGSTGENPSLKFEGGSSSATTSIMRPQSPSASTYVGVAGPERKGSRIDSLMGNSSILTETNLLTSILPRQIEEYCIQEINQEPMPFRDQLSSLTAMDGIAQNDGHHERGDFDSSQVLVTSEVEDSVTPNPSSSTYLDGDYTSGRSYQSGLEDAELIIDDRPDLPSVAGTDDESMPLAPQSSQIKLPVSTQGQSTRSTDDVVPTKPNHDEFVHQNSSESQQPSIDAISQINANQFALPRMPRYKVESVYSDETDHDPQTTEPSISNVFHGRSSLMEDDIRVPDGTDESPSHIDQRIDDSPDLSTSLPGPESEHIAYPLIDRPTNNIPPQPVVQTELALSASEGGGTVFTTRITEQDRPNLMEPRQSSPPGDTCDISPIPAQPSGSRQPSADSLDCHPIAIWRDANHTSTINNQSDGLDDELNMHREGETSNVELRDSCFDNAARELSHIGVRMLMCQGPQSDVHAHSQCQSGFEINSGASAEAGEVNHNIAMDLYGAPLEECARMDSQNNSLPINLLELRQIQSSSSRSRTFPHHLSIDSDHQGVRSLETSLRLMSSDHVEDNMTMHKAGHKSPPNVVDVGSLEASNMGMIDMSPKSDHRSPDDIVQGPSYVHKDEQVLGQFGELEMPPLNIKDSALSNVASLSCRSSDQYFNPDVRSKLQTTMASSSIVMRLKEIRRTSGQTLRKQISTASTASPWFTSCLSDYSEYDCHSIDIGSRAPQHPEQGSWKQQISSSAPREKTAPPISFTGFRTNISYFVPLRTLRNYYGSTVDVIANVISSSSIEKSKSGPQDFQQDIDLIDPSSLPSHVPDIGVARLSTVAKIFRPKKSCLPCPISGDAILLRNFRVQTIHKRLGLLSTEQSAWAVFRRNAHVEVKGPPVEFGPEERNFARGLWAWWHSQSDQEMKSLMTAVSSRLPLSAKDEISHCNAHKHGRTALGFDLASSQQPPM